MKELLKKIISPYKTITELEEEIENQDKQYTYLQTTLKKANKTIELYEQENKLLEETNTKYLSKIRELRKELKELKNENKTSRKSS